MSPERHALSLRPQPCCCSKLPGTGSDVRKSLDAEDPRRPPKPQKTLQTLTPQKTPVLFVKGRGGFLGSSAVAPGSPLPRLITALCPWGSSLNSGGDFPETLNFSCTARARKSRDFCWLWRLLGGLRVGLTSTSGCMLYTCSLHLWHLGGCRCRAPSPGVFKSCRPELQSLLSVQHQNWNHENPHPARSVDQFSTVKEKACTPEERGQNLQGPSASQPHPF